MDMRLNAVVSLSSSIVVGFRIIDVAIPVLQQIS